jgi:hypothetical protein
MLQSSANLSVLSNHIRVGANATGSKLAALQRRLTFG